MMARSAVESNMQAEEVILEVEVQRFIVRSSSSIAIMMTHIECEVIV